jgi:hypothetical protein
MSTNETDQDIVELHAALIGYRINPKGELLVTHRDFELRESDQGDVVEQNAPEVTIEFRTGVSKAAALRMLRRVITKIQKDDLPQVVSKHPRAFAAGLLQLQEMVSEINVRLEDLPEEDRKGVFERLCSETDEEV